MTTPMSTLSKEGRRRLKPLLSLLTGGPCAILMALVLLYYGTPYNPVWWFVMPMVLVAAFVLPWLLVRPIEWVIEGYLDDR
jgi:hypothetical protein